MMDNSGGLQNTGRTIRMQSQLSQCCQFEDTSSLRFTSNVINGRPDIISDGIGVNVDVDVLDTSIDEDGNDNSDDDEYNRYQQQQNASVDAIKERTTTCTLGNNVPYGRDVVNERYRLSLTKEQEKNLQCSFNRYYEIDNNIQRTNHNSQVDCNTNTVINLNERDRCCSNNNITAIPEDNWSTGTTTTTTGASSSTTSTGTSSCRLYNEDELVLTSSKLKDTTTKKTAALVLANQITVKTSLTFPEYKNEFFYRNNSKIKTDNKNINSNSPRIFKTSSQPNKEFQMATRTFCQTDEKQHKIQRILPVEDDDSSCLFSSSSPSEYQRGERQILHEEPLRVTSSFVGSTTGCNTLSHSSNHSHSRTGMIMTSGISTTKIVSATPLSAASTPTTTPLRKKFRQFTDGEIQKGLEVASAAGDDDTDVLDETVSETLFVGSHDTSSKHPEISNDIEQKQQLYQQNVDPKTERQQPPPPMDWLEQTMIQSTASYELIALSISPSTKSSRRQQQQDQYPTTSQETEVATKTNTPTPTPIPTTPIPATPSTPRSVSHVIHNPLTGYSPNREKDVYGNNRRRRHEIMGLTLFSYANQHHPDTGHDPNANNNNDISSHQQKLCLLPRSPFPHSQIQKEQQQLHETVQFEEEQVLIPFLSQAASFDSDYIIEHRARKIRNELFQTELLEIAYEAQRAADEGKEVFSVIPSISYRNYISSQEQQQELLHLQQQPSIFINKKYDYYDDNNNCESKNKGGDDNNNVIESIEISEAQRREDLCNDCDKDKRKNVNDSPHLTHLNKYSSITLPFPPLSSSNCRNCANDISTTIPNTAEAESVKSHSKSTAPMSSLQNTPCSSSDQLTASRLLRRSTYSGADTSAPNPVHPEMEVPPSNSIHSHIHRRRASMTPQPETTMPQLPRSKQSLLRSVKYCGTSIMEESVIEVSASDLRRSARKKQQQLQHQQLHKAPNSSCKIPVIDLRDANEVLPAFANLHRHVKMHMYRMKVTPSTQLCTFEQQRTKQQQNTTTNRLLRPLSPLSLLFSKNESLSPRGCHLISPTIKSNESTTTSNTAKLVCSANPTVVSFYDCQSSNINITSSSYSFDHQTKQPIKDGDNSSTIDPRSNVHKLATSSGVDSCGAIVLASTCKGAAQDAADTLCANQMCVVHVSEGNIDESVDISKDTNINTDSSHNIGTSANNQILKNTVSSEYAKTRSYHTSGGATQSTDKKDFAKELNRPKLDVHSQMPLSPTWTVKSSILNSTQNQNSPPFHDGGVHTNRIDNDNACCKSLVGAKGAESPPPFSKLSSSPSSLTPLKHYEHGAIHAMKRDRIECSSPTQHNRPSLWEEDVVRMRGTRSPCSMDLLIQPRALFDAEIDDDDDDDDYDFSTLEKDDIEDCNHTINVRISNIDSENIDVETQLSTCTSEQQKEIAKIGTTSTLNQSFGSANDFVTPARLRKLRSGRHTSVVAESSTSSSIIDYMDEFQALDLRSPNANASIVDTTEVSPSLLKFDHGKRENRQCEIRFLHVPSIKCADELRNISLNTKRFDTAAFKNGGSNYTRLQATAISDTSMGANLRRHSWDNADSFRTKQCFDIPDSPGKFSNNGNGEVLTGAPTHNFVERYKPHSNTRITDGTNEPLREHTVGRYAQEKEDRTKVLRKQHNNSGDCGIFLLPIATPIVLDQGGKSMLNFQESKSIDKRDANEFQGSRCTDEPSLASTTWSGFVRRKRNDAIYHCKSVLEVHDRTNKSIRAAVQRLSNNLSPVRNRSIDEDWHSMNSANCSTMLRIDQKQKILPDDNDKFLSNFMYCPKAIADIKLKQDGNDEVKIEGEGDAIVMPQQVVNDNEPQEEVSRYPCGSGLLGMDDFRQDYCCGATDNYDTMINSIRNQHTSSTDRSKSSAHFVARPIHRNSSLHIVRTCQVSHAAGSNLQPSSFTTFERSLADTESWLDAATEKLDYIFYQVMGGSSRMFSNRRKKLSSDELGSGQFEFQAPLLRKSINLTPKLN